MSEDTEDLIFIFIVALILILGLSVMNSKGPTTDEICDTGYNDAA